MGHPLLRILEDLVQENVVGRMDSLWAIYVTRQKDSVGLIVPSNSSDIFSSKICIIFLVGNTIKRNFNNIQLISIDPCILTQCIVFVLQWRNSNLYVQ